MLQGHVNKGGREVREGEYGHTGRHVGSQSTFTSFPNDFLLCYSIKIRVVLFPGYSFLSHFRFSVLLSTQGSCLLSASLGSGTSWLSFEFGQGEALAGDQRAEGERHWAGSALLPLCLHGHSFLQEAPTGL